MYIPITMYMNEEENQDIIIFASAIGDFNIAQNEEAAVSAAGITYSDYNGDNDWCMAGSMTLKRINSDSGTRGIIAMMVIIPFNKFFFVVRFNL